MRSSRFLAALVALTAAAVAAGPAGAAPTTRNFTFLANVNEYPPVPATGNGYSACWSYVHGDGREYAILGTVNGTAIYNVVDPSAPYRVALIPGPFSIWREMKSYRNWIYIVTEGTGTGQGLQIVRMTDPEHPVLAATYATNFVRSHTVAIDTTRALLICNGTNNVLGYGTGMRVLSIANPEAPVELGWWPGGTIPVAAQDYVHDCVPVGTVLYAASIYGGFARTFDFTNPAAPALQRSWTYPGAFTHNIWPSPDGKTIYVTDETDGEPLKIFDATDPIAPDLVNGITSNPQAIVHNARVYSGELYLANYTEGIRALDITDPHHPAEFAQADSYFGPSGGFFGVWEVCPFFPSGIVIASDRQTGLYVYRPVRDYGLLRVRVILKDFSPMPGIKVKLTTEGDSLTTPADGIVQFAPSPGAQTVVASAFGYYDASATRLISTGVRDTVILEMIPRPNVSLAGRVRSATTQAVLEDAEVSLNVPQLATAHTSASGDWVIGPVPVDTYHLSVSCPGYIPIDTDTHLNTGSIGGDFQLVPAAIYDDCESATPGWTAGAPGDNATSGQWVRVEPLGTGLLASFAATAVPLVVPECCKGTLACTGQCGAIRTAEEQGAVPGDVAPETDRTPPPGVMCWVTGQGTTPGNINEADVDGGKTSLTTRVFDLTGMSEPRIDYWRWFYSNGFSDDWFAVLISNDDGASWTAVDTLTGPATVKWQSRTIRVGDYVTPSAQVRVRFVAADTGPATIVEAAVDDVTAYDAANAVVAVPRAAVPSALRLETPRPNPSRGGVTIELASPAAGPVDVAVFDVNGRRVCALASTGAAGRQLLRWDGRDERGQVAPAGLYFVRASAGGESAEARLVRVQ